MKPNWGIILRVRGLLNPLTLWAKNKENITKLSFDFCAQLYLLDKIFECVFLPIDCLHSTGSKRAGKRSCYFLYSSTSFTFSSLRSPLWTLLELWEEEILYSSDPSISSFIHYDIVWCTLFGCLGQRRGLKRAVRASSPTVLIVFSEG